MRTLRPPGFTTGARSSIVDTGFALVAVCALGMILGMILSVLEPDAIDRFLVTLTLLWALGAIAVLMFWKTGADAPRFGLANRVTLLRGALAGFPAAALALPALADTAIWCLVLAAALAALLDALDGWLARRMKECSAFGRQFDLEVDAALILVLATLAVQLDKAGPWVLLSGLARYALLAAGVSWPWLKTPLPESRRRRIVCALQTGVLVVVLAPVVPAQAAEALALAGLLALTASFAADILWLKSRSTRGDCK